MYTKKIRESDFELLRIIAILMVIVLHVSNNYGGFEYQQGGEYLTIYLLPQLRSTHGIDGYDCVFVLALALLVSILFKYLKIGSVKSINTLSKATFSVYLLHGYVWEGANNQEVFH